MLFLGKVVLDEIIGTNYIVGKMYAASEFAENKIDHISTFEAMNFAAAKKIIGKLKTPLLVKLNDSMKGRGILKFTSKQKALDFLKKNPRGYIIQEYVPIDHDYRVMVIDGKALGVMKRYVPEKDFRTNIYGTKAEQVLLTKKLAKISIEATKAMNYDIAGIDILKQDGKFKIIEVNIAPEWQKFKKITGINPAQEIVKAALKKYKRKHGF